MSHKVSLVLNSTCTQPRFHDNSWGKEGVCVFWGMVVPVVILACWFQHVLCWMNASNIFNIFEQTWMVSFLAKIFERTMSSWWFQPMSNWIISPSRGESYLLRKWNHHLESVQVTVFYLILLLMEEIPNNHLGCIKPCINYQPQLVIKDFFRDPH